MDCGRLWPRRLSSGISFTAASLHRPGDGRVNHFLDPRAREPPPPIPHRRFPFFAFFWPSHANPTAPPPNPADRAAGRRATPTKLTRLPSNAVAAARRPRSQSAALATQLCALRNLSALIIFLTLTRARAATADPTPPIPFLLFLLAEPRQPNRAAAEPSRPRRQRRATPNAKQRRQRSTPGEMLLPIPGKKGKEAVARPAERPSACQTKAG